MRPSGLWYRWRISFVSIHASVKDATQAGLATCFGNSVSIHASVKDATDLRFLLWDLPEFQSTHL